MILSKNEKMTGRIFIESNFTLDKVGECEFSTTNSYEHSMLIRIWGIGDWKSSFYGSLRRSERKDITDILFTYKKDISSKNRDRISAPSIGVLIQKDILDVSVLKGEIIFQYRHSDLSVLIVEGKGAIVKLTDNTPLPKFLKLGRKGWVETDPSKISPEDLERREYFSNGVKPLDIDIEVYSPHFKSKEEYTSGFYVTTDVESGKYLRVKYLTLDKDREKDLFFRDLSLSLSNTPFDGDKTKRIKGSVGMGLLEDHRPILLTGRYLVNIELEETLFIMVSSDSIIKMVPYHNGEPKYIEFSNGEWKEVDRKYVNSIWEI